MKNRKKFVLCPSRHSHEEIDGLPSIFKDTLDIECLEFTDEFKTFLNSSASKLILYITGLTPAYIELMDYIDYNFEYNSICIIKRQFNRKTGSYDLNCRIKL